MGYIIKFETTIEWEISDAEAKVIKECVTPKAFIDYQTKLLNGTQSLEDFVANGVIRSGNWAVYTEDAVDMGGDWKEDK
jgi:hypothetical protein